MRKKDKPAEEEKFKRKIRKRINLWIAKMSEPGFYQDFQDYQDVGTVNFLLQ